MTRLGVLPTAPAFSVKKKHLAAMIVATIQRNGGRFLQRRGGAIKNSEPDSCVYIEVSDAMAIQKTKHTFRHQMRLLQDEIAISSVDNAAIEHRSRASRDSKQCHPTFNAASRDGHFTLSTENRSIPLVAATPLREAPRFNLSWCQLPLSLQDDVDAANLHRLRMQMAASKADRLARTAVINHNHCLDACIMAMSPSSSSREASLKLDMQFKLLDNASSKTQLQLLGLPPLFFHQQNAMLELKRYETVLKMSSFILQQTQQHSLHPTTLPVVHGVDVANNISSSFGQRASSLPASLDKESLLLRTTNGLPSRHHH
jgi:hypothetical protein